MFEHFVYLLVLIGGITGMLLTDYRWKLALFSTPKPTIITVGIGVIFFSIWDLAGISGGIFYVGNSSWLTGIRLFAQYPLEELFFLILLSYSTLVIWRGIEKAQRS